MKFAFSLLVVAFCAVGCASRPPLPPATPEPRASATAAPGTTLQALGFANGPEKLSLPSEMVVVDKVDQPNVVAIYMSAPTFDGLAAHLRTSLPTAGLQITRESSTGILFEGSVWEGSATVSGQTSAITLRRR